MLYAAVRRVLPPGVRMFVEVDGVEPGGLAAPMAAVPFGGEGRFVFPQSGETGAAGQGRVTLPHKKAKAKYTVTLITPAILPRLEIGAEIEHLTGGKLVSLVVSGLSTTASFRKVRRRDPNPDKDVIDRVMTGSVLVYPAGAVFAFESASAPKHLPEAIGAQTHRGYGRYLVGDWT